MLSKESDCAAKLVLPGSQRMSFIPKTEGCPDVEISVFKESLFLIESSGLFR